MQEMQEVEERAMINGVCIFGTHLLHPKMVDVIKYALVNEPDEDLQAIFVSTIGPRDKVGQYHHHSRSFVMSLPQIMEDAVNIIGSTNDIGLSISAHVWFGMIYTIFHELHHNIALKFELAAGKCYLDLDDNWHEMEEELAQEYAEEKVEEAIINCNAEVPKDIMDIPWIGERIMDLLVQTIKDDPDWVRTIKDRLDNGIIFESKDDIYDSIVEYFLATTKHPEKYEKENEGAAIKMVAETPNLFDQKILPGGQRELFPENLGESVSPPMSDAETKEIAQLTEELVLQKGETPMHDDVHDHLPPEATMSPDECGSCGSDPFAPDFTNGGEPTQTATNDPFATNFPGLAGQAVEAAKAVAKITQPNAKNILMGLYMRLYQQMFTGDVYTPIALTDAEKTLRLVIGCHIWNGQQVICADIAKTGTISGLKWKNGTVPAYDIILNWNGKARRMRLIAQNPNKTSTYAARARAGEKIAWLIEVLADGQSEWCASIENGIYKRCERK